MEKQDKIVRMQTSVLTQWYETLSNEPQLMVRQRRIKVGPTVMVVRPDWLTSWCTAISLFVCLRVG